jgi:hypothetical protein
LSIILFYRPFSQIKIELFDAFWLGVSFPVLSKKLNLLIEIQLSLHNDFNSFVLKI